MASGAFHPARANEPALLFYDEDCGFCRWMVAKVLRRDRRRRLHALPIESPEGEVVLASVPMADRMRSWHLASEEELVSGGAVFAPLLRLLPGGRPLARLAELFPRTCKYGYFVIADRRMLWGQRLPRRWIAAADSVIAAHGRGVQPGAAPTGSDG